jgi:hypothetical protein
MAKSYEDCFDELLAESEERIEANPQLHWDEAVREAIEDSVFGHYTQETLENILNSSQPNDEWQVYCSDMQDYQQVQEAMAYTAMRTDIMDELEEKYE